jgi:hypothetical protein
MLTATATREAAHSGPTPDGKPIDLRQGPAIAIDGRTLRTALQAAVTTRSLR